MWSWMHKSQSNRATLNPKRDDIRWLSIETEDILNSSEFNFLSMST